MNRTPDLLITKNRVLSHVLNSHGADPVGRHNNVVRVVWGLASTTVVLALVVSTAYVCAAFWGAASGDATITRPLAPQQILLTRSRIRVRSVVQGTEGIECQTVTRLSPAQTRKKPTILWIAGFLVSVRLIWLLDLGSNQGPTD